MIAPTARSIGSLFIAAVTLAAAPLAAQRPAGRVARQAPAVRAQYVATVEGISEYRLPNGLRVVLFPDRSRPSTTVNITYFVGSRHEGYGESGMAHLLEHMVFKGTPRHPNIPQELTEHGGRANGTTWYDRTNYFITFAASDSNLAWALRMEADRMVNSFIRAEDLASEMTVVRNEFEAGENNPLNVLEERTMATAYLWHGYGRSTIGARADLEGVPIDRLQAFYRKYYQPDNAILVVSGQFDTTRTLRWIEASFGAIALPDRGGANRVWATYTREPVQDGERAVTVRRVGDVQYVMAAYHAPAGSHDDFPAVDLLADVLGNTPSGRLYRALVEPGLASRIGVFAYQLREPGLLIAYAEVRLNQSLDSARAVLLQTLDAVAANPPTAEEVERSRARRLRDIQLEINNSERVGLDLTEWAATGDWRLLFIHRDRLGAVTVPDAGRVARAYLVPSNRTVGLFIPERSPVRAAIAEARDIAPIVSAYRGSETVTTGEAFEPTVPNIESRIRRFDLPNGLRVALLRKQTRGQAVLVQFAQRMGTEAALTNRAATGSLTAGMLMRGTQRRTRQQLVDTLALLRTQLSVSGSATIVSGSFETVRDNLTPALRLLAEVVREPAFDSTEFQTLRRERLAQVEAQRTEPGALASITFQRLMFPRPRGHVSYVELPDEAVASLGAVQLADVRAFHRDFYGFGAGGNLTILGDFDPAAVESLVRELFGDWPRRQPYARVWTTPASPPDTVISIETPDKANAFLYAGLNFRMRDDHADYPALLLGGYMLGGGFLNSRLATRIRQREGLSYGVGGGIAVRPIDTVGTLNAFAIYAPQNADRVVAALRDEIERAVREGFTPAEVEAAQRGWMQQQEVGRATDNQLAFNLHNGLFLGRTLEWDAQLEARVRALTPDVINQAVRRWINPAALAIVKAGSFAGAGVSSPRPVP